MSTMSVKTTKHTTANLNSVEVDRTIRKYLEARREVQLGELNRLTEAVEKIRQDSSAAYESGDFATSLHHSLQAKALAEDVARETEAVGALENALAEVNRRLMAAI